MEFLIWILSQPLFWAGTGILVGLYMFYRGFRLLQLKRRISNVPRSTIRAAAVGPVEVSGTAMGPYTLVSPLSQSDCLYYRLVVEPGLGGIGAMVQEAANRHELTDDMLLKFPHLMVAPIIFSVIWAGLFQQFSFLDVEAMLRTYYRHVLTCPDEQGHRDKGGRKSLR